MMIYQLVLTVIVIEDRELTHNKNQNGRYHVTIML